MSIYIIAFMVLIVAWFCGWAVFHLAGGVIHILLAFALAALILHFVRARHGESDLRITR